MSVSYGVRVFGPEEEPGERAEATVIKETDQPQGKL